MAWLTRKQEYLIGDSVWEDFIALNATAELNTRVLGSISDYLALRDRSVLWGETKIPLTEAAQKDAKYGWKPMDS